MFRSHRLFSLLLFALILACSDGGGPLAADRTTADLLPVQSDVVESGTGVFTFNGINPNLACIGEGVRSVVHAPYHYKVHTTPSGNTVYVELWDHKSVTGTLTGLTTGTVWTRTRTVSPFIDVSTGGDSRMTMYIVRATFVSETGPTIEAKEVFHITRDASGRVTSEHYSFRCWLK